MAKLNVPQHVPRTDSQNIVQLKRMKKEITDSFISTFNVLIILESPSVQFPDEPTTSTTHATCSYKFTKFIPYSLQFKNY